MCDPLTIAMAAFSAVGSIAQANQQAKMEERQARIEEQAAAENARRTREEFKRLSGEQTAGFLKGGEAIEGTPAEVLARTAEDAELEALSIIHGGQLQAESHRIQAKNIKSTGRMNAIGSLIGAASPVSSGKSLLSTRRTPAPVREIRL